MQSENDGRSAARIDVPAVTGKELACSGLPEHHADTPEQAPVLHAALLCPMCGLTIDVTCGIVANRSQDGGMVAHALYRGECACGNSASGTYALDLFSNVIECAVLPELGAPTTFDVSLAGANDCPACGDQDMQIHVLLEGEQFCDHWPDSLTFRASCECEACGHNGSYVDDDYAGKLFDIGLDLLPAENSNPECAVPDELAGGQMLSDAAILAAPVDAAPILDGTTICSNAICHGCQGSIAMTMTPLAHWAAGELKVSVDHVGKCDHCGVTQHGSLSFDLLHLVQKQLLRKFWDEPDYLSVPTPKGSRCPFCGELQLETNLRFESTEQLALSCDIHCQACGYEDAFYGVHYEADIREDVLGEVHKRYHTGENVSS